MRDFMKYIRKFIKPSMLICSCLILCSSNLSAQEKVKNSFTKDTILVRPTNPARLSSLSQKQNFNQIARNTVDQYAQDFGVKDPNSELVEVSQQTDKLGFRIFRFAQIINGYNVYAAELRVVIKANGEVNSISGGILKTNGVTFNNNLNAAQAENYAVDFFAPKLASAKADPNPIVLSANFAKFSNDNGIYLVYRVNVNSGQDSSTLFIDAENGLVRAQQKSIKHINRQVYDCTLGSCYIDLPDPNSNHIFGRSEGKNKRGNNPYQVDSPNDVDKAYTQIGEFHSYILNKFGINGANNLGGTGDGFNFAQNITPVFTYIPSFSCPNAYYDPQDGSLNFCTELVDPDVSYHEFMHAVTQHSIVDSFGTPVGLTYENEPGALNESFSDIFAQLAQGSKANWLVGDKINIPGLPKPLRDMKTPTRKGQPDSFYNSKYLCAPNGPDEFNDFGGVHINSGVFNKAAYLMAKGGTFNGCTIKKIPTNNLQQILMRTLRTYLPTNADFNFIAAALELSCFDLYPNDLNMCTQVRNALQATYMDQAGRCSGIAKQIPLCSSLLFKVPGSISFQSAITKQTSSKTTHKLEGTLLSKKNTPIYNRNIKIVCKLSTNLNSKKTLFAKTNKKGKFSSLLTVDNGKNYSCEASTSADVKSESINVESI